MRQGAKSMIMWYQSVWERYAFWGPLFIIVNNPEYRKKTTKGIAVTANNCAQYSTYIMSPSLPPRKFFSPSPFYSLSFLGVSEFISRGDIYFSYLSIVSSQFLPFKLSFLTLISFVTTVIPYHYFVCFSRSLLHFHTAITVVLPISCIMNRVTNLFGRFKGNGNTSSFFNKVRNSFHGFIFQWQLLIVQLGLGQE